ncbi:hypothetical protein GCM10027517_36630 [Phycicoccus ginsengisoli]
MNGAPSTLVSPGLWGFVAFFVLAIALYLLMRNMNARMRRMSYRAEELRKEAEAQSEADPQAKAGRAGGARSSEADGPAAQDPAQDPAAQAPAAQAPAAGPEDDPGAAHDGSDGRPGPG